ncbi:MAG: membrane protein insertion efficiency factor YidD [Solirubrobacterales bacterium]
MKRLPGAILLAPIRVYQRLISPAFAPRCRYYPTCSNYAVEAIRELGPIRGLILACWRLLRCNPFSHGGVDQLSDRRLFRDTPTRSERAAQDQSPPQTPQLQLPSAGGSSGADLT